MKRPPLLSVLAILLLTSSSAIAQWTEMGGLFGGHVHRIAVDGRTVYAGTATRGLFRSDDAGLSWTHVPLAQYGSDPIHDIAILPRNVIVIPGGGRLRNSTDGGRTFTVPSYVGEGETKRVLTAYRGALFLGLAQYTGIHRSTDGARNWTRVTAGITEYGGIPPAFVAIEGGAPGLFAAADTALYRSLDTGRSWRRVMANVPSPLTSVAVHGDIVLVGTASAGVLRSSDGGATWAPSSHGIPGRRIVTIASVGSSILVATSDVNGVYRSSDGGISWARSSAGMASARVDAIEGNDTLAFAGALGEGVYRSTDGGLNWSQSNVGLNDLWVDALLPVGDSMYAATGNGIYRRTIGGRDWTRLDPGPDHRFITALAATSARLYAASLDGRLHRSSDDGATWRDAGDGLPGSPIASLDTLGGMLFAGTERGVYFTSDDGDSWQRAEALGDSAYLVISHGGFLFAGATQGTRKARTTNGTDWLDVSEGTGRSATKSWARDGTRLFISVVGYDTVRGSVYLSADSGATWSTVFDNGGGSSYIGSMVAIGDAVIVANNIGMDVYRYEFDTWTELKEGRQSTFGPRVSAMVIEGNDLIAALTGHGVWTYALPPSAVFDGASPVSPIIAPNPATGFAYIELGDAIVGGVAITVIDALGAIVARSAADGGEQRVRIDLTGLRAGMYFCRVVSPRGARAARLLVR